MLFLLYGYYRAVNQPGMSVILTIASLGTRVALAYLLSATPLGVTGHLAQCAHWLGTGGRHWHWLLFQK